MDKYVRRLAGVGVVCLEELMTRVGDTKPLIRRTTIAAEPLSKRRPFDSRMALDHSRRHLRLVPDPAVAATIAAAEPTADDGLASVTHLPTYLPTEKDHDGDDGEDGGAAAPEVDQGTRPRTDGELEEQENEEDLPRRVAAAIPVPRL
jgi:hypothetical protein